MLGQGRERRRAAPSRRPPFGRGISGAAEIVRRLVAQAAVHPDESTLRVSQGAARSLQPPLLT